MRFCRNSSRTAVLTAVVLLFWTTAYAFAQSNTATIRGSVIDPQGHAVAGAIVTVTNTDLSLKRTVITDTGGFFRVSNLAPGAFTVESTVQGLATRQPIRLTLALGSTVQVNIELSVATIQQHTTISARSGTSEGNTLAPAVNIDSPAAGIFIPGNTVTYLPLRDRDYTRLEQLSAGVDEDAYSAGLIVSGQRSSAIITQVDGVNFNDPLQGGRRGAGDGAFFLPQTVVREFQIVRSGVTAETGNTNAGLISVVTKEGSNRFHGEAFYTGRPAPLTASDAFGHSLDNSQNTLGGSLGGPVRRNRAFFYAGIEKDFLHVPYFSQFAPQPSGALIPPSVSAQQGEIVEKNNPLAAFGRFDYILGPRDTINAQLGLNRIRASNVGDASTRTLSTITNAGHLGGQSIWAKTELTTMLTSSTVSQLLVSWSGDHRSFAPNSTSPEFDINGFGTLGGSSLGQHLYASDQLQLTDNLTIAHGSSLLILGGTFAYEPFYEQQETNLNGRFDYNSLADYLANNPRRYQQTFVTGDTLFHASIRELDLFVNEKLSLSPKLTLTAGLRWAAQWNPQPPHPNPAIAQTQSIPNDLSQWQPRVGLAWNAIPTRTMVRLSAGLYSAPIPGTTFHRIALDNGIQTLSVDSYFNPEILSVATSRGESFRSIPVGAIPALIFGISPRFRNPTSFQTAATVEEQVVHKLSLSAGYMHSDTWDLQRLLDENLEPPVVAADGYPVFPPSRPNPAIGRLLINESNAHSTYNGLLLTGVLPISRRTTVTANYTFSRTRDDDSYQGPFGIVSALNPFDLRTERSDSLQDIRSNFNLSAVINLPAGFKFNPIFIAHSGQPYTPIIGFDTQHDANDFNDRAVIDGAIAARNSLRQPGFSDLDIRIVKDITLKGEGHHLDLFMDVFNVANSSNLNFGPAGVSFYGNSAYPVFSAGEALFAPNVAHLGGPREIQFTARLVAF